MPVVLRSLVNVNGHGGTFDGTLLGGNGRRSWPRPTRSSSTCRRSDALNVSLSWLDNAGTEVIGWLIDLDGTLLGSSSSLYVDLNTGAATRTHGLEAFAPRRRPAVVVRGHRTTPTGGTVPRRPTTARSRSTPQIHATGRPDGDKVQAGKPVTATVKVTNTGPGTMDVFADPRPKESETDSPLAIFAPAKVRCPAPTCRASWSRPRPTVVGAAQGSAPMCSRWLRRARR